MVCEKVKLQRKEAFRRMRISLYAYAYEFTEPIVDDHEYDKLAYEINLDQETNRPDLDIWFKENYSPSTGMWIHKHPELDKVEIMYLVYNLPNIIESVSNKLKNLKK